MCHIKRENPEIWAEKSHSRSTSTYNKHKNTNRLAQDIKIQLEARDVHIPQRGGGDRDPSISTGGGGHFQNIFGYNEQEKVVSDSLVAIIDTYLQESSPKVVNVSHYARSLPVRVLQTSREVSETENTILLTDPTILDPSYNEVLTLLLDPLRVFLLKFNRKKKCVKWKIRVPYITDKNWTLHWDDKYEKLENNKRNQKRKKSKTSNFRRKNRLKGDVSTSTTYSTRASSKSSNKMPSATTTPTASTVTRASLQSHGSDEGFVNVHLGSAQRLRSTTKTRHLKHVYSTMKTPNSTRIQSGRVSTDSEATNKSNPNITPQFRPLEIEIHETRTKEEEKKEMKESFSLENKETLTLAAMERGYAPLADSSFAVMKRPDLSIMLTKDEKEKEKGDSLVLQLSDLLEDVGASPLPGDNMDSELDLENTKSTRL